MDTGWKKVYFINDHNQELESERNSSSKTTYHISADFYRESSGYHSHCQLLKMLIITQFILFCKTEPRLP